MSRIENDKVREYRESAEKIHKNIFSIKGLPKDHPANKGFNDYMHNTRQRLQLVIDEINSKEAIDGSPKVLARMDVLEALAKGFPECFDITIEVKKIKLKEAKR